MKTLKIIASLILALIIGAGIYHQSHLAFWIVFGIIALPVLVFLIMARSAKTLNKQKEIMEAAYRAELSKIKFNHIKPVTLNGKIRVFNKWGNLLCDIPQNGVYKIDGASIAEGCEIAFIDENYSKVYDWLNSISI